MAIFKPKQKINKNCRVDRMKKEITNPIEFRNLNLQIRADLLKKFKCKTVENNTTMTEIIIHAIKDYLREK